MSETTSKQEEIWELARNSQVIDHMWLNAFSCIRPSDEFAAEVGHDIIKKIMQSPGRKVVLTLNAS